MPRPQKKIENEKIRAKAVGNSDKSNGKYGKKQLKNRAKAMGNSGKNYGSFGQFHELTILFSKITS